MFLVYCLSNVGTSFGAVDGVRLQSLSQVPFRRSIVLSEGVRDTSICTSQIRSTNTMYHAVLVPKMEIDASYMPMAVGSAKMPVLQCAQGMRAQLSQIHRLEASSVAAAACCG
jgi:hypothetical protein